MKRQLFLGISLLTALTATAIYVDGDVWVDYLDGDYGFVVNGNEATLVYASTGLAGAVTVPETLSGGGRKYTLTAIEGAFYDCWNITALTLPEGVTRIGDEAFVNCASMTSITLPSGLTSIGDYAFEACTNLKSITIPTSVGNISESAFSGCQNLTIAVAEGNGVYKSVNGGLLNKDGTRLIRGAGGVAEFTVSETVTSLGDFAFDGLDTLTTVHFQGDVPSYRGYPVYAFNSTITQGTYTAAHATSWERVLQDGKWEVELTEDNDSEDDWQSWSVKHAISMMPHGIWLLQSTNAKWLTIGGSETCVCRQYSGSGYVISKCSPSINGELVIPGEIDGITVSHICMNAFQGCHGLTKVTIPASVMPMQQPPGGPFTQCNGLQEAIIEDGAECLGQELFYACPNLRRVVVPASVRVISFTWGECPNVKVEVAEGNETFYSEDGSVFAYNGDGSMPGMGKTLVYYAGGRVDYEIPDGTEAVAYPFMTATLPNTVMVPPSVKTLRYDAFRSDSGVISMVTFEGAPPEIEAFGMPTNALGWAVQTVRYPASWRNAWRTAMAEDGDGNPNAWHGIAMTEWADISGPALSLTYENDGTSITVTGLSDKATYGDLIIPKALEGVPVTKIAVGAFKDCTGLTSVTIPGCVNEIAAGTFENCPALRTITFEEGVMRLGSSTVEGFANWVRQCQNLSTINIPSTVTEMGFGWEDCPNATVTIAQENTTYTQLTDGSVVSADGYTLYRCGGAQYWERYEVPQTVTTVLPCAFYERANLVRTLIIGAQVTDFRGIIRGDCINRVEVAPENTTYSAADGALYEDGGRTLLSAPTSVATFAVAEGVEAIEDAAFAKSDVSSVTLPSSLIQIGNEAFADCVRLGRLDVPPNVSMIGDDAFDGCTALTTLNFQGMPPTCGEMAWSASAKGTYSRFLSSFWEGSFVAGKWNGLPMSIYVPEGPAGQLIYDDRYGNIVTGLPTHVQGALEIPYGVGFIYPDAFTECTGLSSVTVPGTVSTIEMRTFVRTTGLTSVTFQEGVQSIKGGAFSDCPVLNKVYIPASCTSIETRAFDTCYEIAFEVSPNNQVYSSDDSGALLSKDGSILYVAPGNVTSYTLPPSVHEIAPGAFGSGQSLGRTVLASVELPASVETIGTLAFAFGFGSVNVAPDNPHFTSENGVLYTKDKRVLIHVPNTFTNFTLPDWVEVIDAGAISETNISTLTFPTTGALREIRDQAFWGSNLNTLTLPEGVTTIGYEIAGCCEALTNVTFPSTLTSGSGLNFTDCARLSRLEFRGPPPSGINGITTSFSALRGYYPKSLASAWETVLNKDGTWGHGIDAGEWSTYALPMEAFDDTPTGDLARLTFEDNATGVTLVKVPNIGGVLTIPATWQGKPVTEVAADAFAGCVNLSEVTIPGTIQTIPFGLFSGCSGLTTVTFAEGVQYLALPDSAQTSHRTFEGCVNLRTLKIPSTLYAVAGQYYGDSPSLTFSVAPGNPTVSSVNGALLSKSGEKLWVAPGEIQSYAVPDGVEEIDAHAFDGRIRLSSVSLPASVTNVMVPLLGTTAELRLTVDEGNPNYATQDGSLFNKSLSTLLYYGGGNRDYELPASVTEVGHFAFRGVANVSRVKVHANVTRIDDAAFSGKVGAVEIDPANPYYVSTNEGVVMALPTVRQAGKRLIHMPYNITTYTVPDDVTEIGDYSLWGCQLTSLTLPPMVAFNKGSFSGCDNLTDLTFKGRPTDVVICMGFEGWPERAIGRYPSLWTGAWTAAMENGRWQGLPMKSYTISGVAGLLTYSDDSVAPIVTGFTSTPNGALEIPQGVAGIAAGALQNQPNLTSVSVPGSVNSIGADTFGDNPRLTTVSFGEGVTSIAAGAFRDCTALTKVTIPASCGSIESGAFGICGDIVFEVAAGNADFKSVDGALLSADGTRLLAAPGNVAEYTVPEGVQTIDDNAFSGRPRLTAISLPSTLRAVQPCAFLASAAAVSVDGANRVFWASDGGLLQRNISVDGIVWEALLHVPTSATQYVIPDGVNTVGAYAFTDCVRLTSVTMPATEDRLEVASTAFDGCTDLRTVTFRGRPAEYLLISVKEWPTNAIGTYPRLWAKRWEERLEEDGTFAGLPMQQATESGAAALLKYGGTADSPTVARLASHANGSLEIPYGVTAIEPDALADCGISSVSVPGSVSTLVPSTFVRNAALSTVTLERGVAVIQAGAFDTCDALTKVIIPDTCTAIAPLAFKACPEIAFEVAASNPSYRSDASGALLSKAGDILYVAPGNVSAYMIPDGVTTIAAGAFAAGQSNGWNRLDFVSIPSSVTNIALGAFAGFGSVTVAEGNAAYASLAGALLSADGTVLYHVPNSVSGSYKVPEGVEEITEHAFQSCTALNAVTLPASLRVIGRDVLVECPNMATGKLTFLGLPPNVVADNTFAPCVAASYPKELWRDWTAVIKDGVWNGLTMTTDPFIITLNIVGAGSITDSLGANYRGRPNTARYQPAQTVTLTATPDNGHVFLGWSGEGLAKDGTSARFIADGDTTITAHFVTQEVAESMEAVGVGGDGGASLEEALANGEVVRTEEIPDMVKDMAFGAPVIEVTDEEVVLEIGFQYAETLGEWKAMDLQAIEKELSSDNKRLRLIMRKPADSSAAFYKFVVPNEDETASDAAPKR